MIHIKNLFYESLCILRYTFLWSRRKQSERRRGLYYIPTYFSISTGKFMVRALTTKLVVIKQLEPEKDSLDPSFE